MKTRFICITVLIIAAFFIVGCATERNSTSSDSGISSATASDRVVATVAEEDPPATPHPGYKVKYEQLIDRYTAQNPPYKAKDRQTPDPIDEIPAPRYVKRQSGWYKNDSAQETGKAVIMLTGDLMCQGRQQRVALRKYGEYNFNASFDIVKDIFSEADFVVGNLETSLCSKAPYMSEEAKVDDKPHCNAPATFLGALRYSGFDAVVCANNHCCDTGVYGILDTLDNIETYRLMHTGLFAGKKELRFLLVNVNGIKIAVMSYATYFNTKEVYLTEDGRARMLNKYSRQIITRDVQDARACGAEFIIAYNHWGTEYTNTENETQIARAQEMADAGVDYIIGSHPHVLQRYDILTARDGRKVPVVYSMGNFVSHMKVDITQDTLILRMELTKTADGIEVNDGIIPCKILREYNDVDYIVMPISPEYNNGVFSDELTEAYKRITDVMGEKIEVLGSYDFTESEKAA